MGSPNGAGFVQIRSGSSITFQSRFFKGLVSLYFLLKSACSFGLIVSYAADAKFRFILRGYYAVHIHSSFRSETAKRRRYICTVCMQPQESPEHTSEHVKSISWGRAPSPPSHNPLCGVPLFVFALGPPSVALPCQEVYD